LKEVFGSGSLSIEIQEKGTLADMLTELSHKHGEDFQRKTGRNFNQALKDRFNLFLNGKRIKLPEDLNLQLKDQDEIVILQPVGGGAVFSESPPFIAFPPI
jgi:molybdopterin converting factor small subunit